MHARFSLLPLLFLITALLTGQVKAQQLSIDGSLKNYSDKTVFLQAFMGADAKICDSAVTDVHGHFNMLSAGPKPFGLYRILLENRRFLDFVYTGEAISFSTDINHLLDSMKISQSGENKLYYQYLKYRVNSQYRLQILRRKLPEIPVNNEHSRALRDEILSLEQQELDFTSHLIQNHPASFTAKLIRIDRTPAPDPLWDSQRKTSFTYLHYLDEGILNDTTLLRTNAISAKIISYLSLVITMNKNADSLSEKFRDAALNLLAAAEPSQPMYKFIREYLSEGFKKLGYNELAREISTLPLPFEYTQHESFVGEKFPVSRYKINQQEIRIPGKDKKTALLISLPACEWGKKMESELVLMGSSLSAADWQMLILTDSIFASDSMPATTTRIVLTEKEKKKLHKMIKNGEGPIVFLIDRQGIIQSQIRSWIHMKKRIEL
ncbi:MAG: hypothetical protein H6542_03050 [Lentimicrobiaceae bacterium]|nr:hypothetical protein [Lentimicrobiaceae bacterium]